MGYSYVTASGSVVAGECKLTSVIVVPTDPLSGAMTIYNATAATANTEVMQIHCGTAAGTTKTWSDPYGIVLDNMFVTITGCRSTVVWD